MLSSEFASIYQRCREGIMIKFKIMCPVCGAVIISAMPESLIWEHCPSCKSHIWDKFDIMMADVHTQEHHVGRSCKIQM